VSDTFNHRIQKFTSSGTFITKWGSEGSGDGELYYPFGIAIDSSGNVYITDSHNHRIQKFSTSGAFLTKWGSYGSGDGEFNSPYGIAIGSSGNIYIVDYINHRIKVFCKANEPPIASIAGGDRTLIINEISSFVGTGSTDSDGIISSYEWDWGDSSSKGTTATTDHKWSAAGKYTVKLTVKDDDGATGQATVKVTVIELGTAIEDTIDLVESMNLPNNVKNILIEKLEGAMDKLADGKWDGAQKKLESFIDKVMNKNDKGKMTDAQAAQLIAMAKRIMDTVNAMIEDSIAEVEDAIDLVNGMGLNSKVADSLVGKLDDAIGKLEDGKLGGAINKLQAFIEEVAAKKNKGKITGAQAKTLTDAAEAIIENIP
jgi:PKD repeat protein